MIANTQSKTVASGGLDREVHIPFTQLHAILEFIAGELPPWRDHPERRTETSERRLTDQLCNHLTSAARKSAVWDILQFRTEIPDETSRSRSIDLSANPCGATVFVEGRRHTQFDMLVPIECKRLPTPREPERDEREYVISEKSSTGGIHRFKLGAHGSEHCLAGMIAYIQADTFDVWKDRVSAWIRDLARTDKSWTVEDLPAQVQPDNGNGLAELRSRHRRAGGLQDIELRHLWIMMN